MCYSRLLVRHHWFVLAFVICICMILTSIGFAFTQFPDFSDPRIGWGARGKGTIFSQLMVLRHASEKFRSAYELPLDTNELFGAFAQFFNVTVDNLDENTYRSDLLAKYDLWQKKNTNKPYNELFDYQNINETFYDHDTDEDEIPDYNDDDDDENSQSLSIYKWHRNQHFDLKNRILKYVDDKVINISVYDFVKNLPQFNKTNYQSARLPFDLFRPYAYLLEEKYRGRAGRDGMIEFYMERTQSNDDILSLNHLRSICTWEKKFKQLLSVEHVPSLSLATFVALYSSKNDCELINSNDIEHFRTILHTCVPYYINGYMDIPLSDQFLNRVVLEHHSDYHTYQEQIKAIYPALRHTCFYKNITRFIFDHFVDEHFINELQHSKTNSKVSISMIYISNYKIIKYNRTRDQTMCLRRQPYSRKYCQERGCIDDFRNNFIEQSCLSQGPPIGNCEKYCHCKYQCLNETEQVILLTPNLKEKELVGFFGKYFLGKKQLSTYKDEFIKLIAFNLANVREKAAMAQIQKDMFLILMAAALIVGITVLYLRSIAIAFMIVVGAALSFGVSYFIYRVVYRIPIFPYMNLMSAFILIGIGCDDIFVFFDTWDQEKTEWLKKYQEKQQADNADIPLNIMNNHEIQSSNDKIKIKKPSSIFQSRKRSSLPPYDSEMIRKVLLNEEALIEIMSKTLKHAASSMFVTSFTTSAAFFTNMLTNISFVQVFGVFTGTCILLYFFITVTAIAAFAVIYEKYIINFTSRLFSICFNKTSNISPTNSSPTLYHRFILVCKDFRNYIFGYLIPRAVIKLRYIFVLLFFVMGILGLVGVFYYPKLQVPSTQKVSFFLKDNPMELYEFSMKSQFNGYSKDESRMFAYPQVSFMFGIRDIDDGYLFDMNDRGNLHLMPVYLHQKNTQEFFKKFIADLGTRRDLFTTNTDLEKDFEAFYQLTTDNILITKIVDERTRLNASKTSHIDMIKYIRKTDTKLIGNLLSDTVRTIGYKIENDKSDQDDYFDRKTEKINMTIYRISNYQLKSTLNPIIDYSNYRKIFNKTLEKVYKEQIERSYNVNEIRNYLNGTVRDKLTEDYHRLALKTAMQCLTGAAGASNMPADFCDRQLTQQRSINWAVLPDKPSPIDGSVRPFAVIITIRGTHNRTNYESYNTYYMKVKNFFDPYIKQHAPEHLQHAWFSSPGFAFYGIQRELLVGSFYSLIASLGIALLILFLTSGNLFIALYALLTITFAIADGVAIFAILEWELGIVEAIIVIMAVGLSVDFVVHFGVGYIHTNPIDIDNERKKVQNRYLSATSESNDDNNNENDYKINTCCLLYKEQQAEREARVKESVSRVGSAVFMAAFTTFAAGFSMTLSSLSAFRQMGQFLMTIMSTSWIFATFFFLPLCATIGPVGFSPKQLQRLYTRFQGLDKRKPPSGYLTREDLLEIREVALNPLGQRLVDVMIQDHGNANRIDFRQFAAILARFRRGKPTNELNAKEKKLLFLFSMYDRNHDSEIDRNELLDILKLMVGGNIHDEQLGTIADHTIEELDADGDLTITFEEFCKTLENIDVDEKMSMKFLN
ncbi:unnamed protein product [Adineta steineri]|uniref:Uncharacterized protein n=1 Tax=Adineta steineri TaxID=433720 RepID=A0A815DXQ3_9BILA|nr:unnamed protein product [Adineta steineri]